MQEGIERTAAALVSKLAVTEQCSLHCIFGCMGLIISECGLNRLGTDAGCEDVAGQYLCFTLKAIHASTATAVSKHHASEPY